MHVCTVLYLITCITNLFNISVLKLNIKNVCQSSFITTTHIIIKFKELKIYKSTCTLQMDFINIFFLFKCIPF